MGRNWLEWIVTAASGLAIISLVLFLGFQAVTATGAPAEIEVTARPEAARTTPAGWLLPATVHNVGDEAAASLVIEASAEVGGAAETRSVTIDLLAGRATADIVVGFSREPDGAVTFTVAGYEVP